MSQPAPSDHVTVNGKRVAMSFSSSVSSAEMELFVQWAPFCSWLSKIERYSESFTLTAIDDYARQEDANITVRNVCSLHHVAPAFT